jgi:hypothetical protein
VSVTKLDVVGTGAVSITLSSIQLRKLIFMDRISHRFEWPSMAPSTTDQRLPQLCIAIESSILASPGDVNATASLVTCAVALVHLDGISASVSLHNTTAATTTNHSTLCVTNATNTSLYDVLLFKSSVTSLVWPATSTTPLLPVAAFLLLSNVSSLIVAVSLDQCVLTGAFQLVRLSSDTSQLLPATADVYCSTWRRHEYSPQSSLAPTSTLGGWYRGVARPTFSAQSKVDTSSVCLTNHQSTTPTADVATIVSHDASLQTPSSSYSNTIPPHQQIPQATRPLSARAPSPTTTVGAIFSGAVSPLLSLSVSIDVAQTKKPIVPLLRTTTSIAHKFFSSIGAVTVVSGVLSGISAGVGTALVRTALTVQLEACAGGSIDSVISGDSGGSDFLSPQVGDQQAPGKGYRSNIVSLLAIVGASALLGALTVGALMFSPCGDRRSSVQVATAAAALPGWWLAGPCAAAVGPFLSSGVSLASVSTWDVPAGDGLLVLLSLGMFLTLSAWSVVALLRPNRRGLFVCTTVGPAPNPMRDNATMRKVVVWLLGGGYLWKLDPSLMRTSTIKQHAAIKSGQRISNTFDRMYPYAYGSLFTSMRPNYYWHFLLDMAANIVVGIIAAVPAMVAARTVNIIDDMSVSNACIGALHATTAVQLLFAFFFVVTRPVAVHWELIAGACMAILGALNALLASIQATSLASDVIDDIGNMVESFQLTASGLAVLCAVAECLLTLFVLKQRRLLLADDIDSYDGGMSSVMAASSTLLASRFLYSPSTRKSSRDFANLQQASCRNSPLSRHHKKISIPRSVFIMQALSVLVQQAANTASTRDAPS